MKRCAILLIIVMLFCGLAFSDTRTTSVIEAKGQGVNREEAIKKALAEAVAKARGVKVGSADYDFGYRSASADIEKKETGGKAVEFDAVSVQTGGSVLKTEVEGLVKTYEVLDEKKIDEGTYEVTLKVWVYDYEAPEKSDRLTLAVMPIKVLSQSYRFGTVDFDAVDISQKLSHKLSVGLTETNKFAVLDREYIEDFAHNRDILLSGDSSLEEQAGLGKVLGADYMLVGVIPDARVDIKQKYSAAVGRPVREYEADFVFDYRLIVAATRQVRLSDTVSISLDETDEVKALVKEWEPDDLDFREMMDNLFARAANQAVETIIDRLYPIRIATVNTDGQVIINQGGRRIARGMLLDVFTPGKEIIDVDTKESLGKTEVLIATIKIDKVTPKISYAMLIEGDISKISKGLICRLKKAGDKPLEGMKSSLGKTPSGGVKLPID